MIGIKTKNAHEISQNNGLRCISRWFSIYLGLVWGVFKVGWKFDLGLGFNTCFVLGPILSWFGVV